MLFRFYIFNRHYETKDKLLSIIDAILTENERCFGIEKKSDNPAVRFANLIETASEKNGRQVVILIDEYDKPILDALFTEYEEQNCQELRSFYSPYRKYGSQRFRQAERTFPDSACKHC